MEKVKLFYKFFLILIVSIIIETGCVKADRDNPEDYIQNGCTLQYNSNEADGGDLPATPVVYRYGKTITVKGNSGNLTKNGYLFAYWAESEDGSGKCYMEGDTITINSDLTLYAQWGTSNGLMYQYENYDNSYSVEKNGSPNGIIVIPSEYNSLPVTAITNFLGCDGIIGFIIPETITYLVNNVFAYCTGLQNIYVSSKNSVFTSVDGVLFTKDKKTLILYPAGRINTSYTVPASVTAITSYAFTYCRTLVRFGVESTNTSITSVDGVLFSMDKKIIICYPRYKEGQSYIIPEETTTIGTTAFDYCQKLLNITLPNGLKTIEANAFEDCSFSEITIPESVTSIGKSAFSSCNNLATITMVSTNPPVLGASAFKYISSSAKIKVPAAALENYKTTSGWSTYETIIEGY